MIIAKNIKTEEILKFENATLAAKHFNAPNLAISAAIRERNGKYGKQPDWIFSNDGVVPEKKEEKFSVKGDKTVDKMIVSRVYDNEEEEELKPSFSDEPEFEEIEVDPDND